MLTDRSIDIDFDLSLDFDSPKPQHVPENVYVSTDFHACKPAYVPKNVRVREKKQTFFFLFSLKWNKKVSKMIYTLPNLCKPVYRRCTTSKCNREINNCLFTMPNHDEVMNFVIYAIKSQLGIIMELKFSI